jgi:CheY-like chemotaxis protein
MDHMMPEMDGIEATAMIRKMGGAFETIPIIALTANAISGIKEMFLENGFNDYLSKPIEIVQLDALIAKWTPYEKRVITGHGLKRAVFDGDGEISIPGIDVKKGINMTGGTPDRYRKVLASFYKDAVDRLPALQRNPEAANLGDFSINAHALKSAAATIGAAELSKEAADLEAAGKAGDMAVITAVLPAFYKNLKDTTERIHAVLEEKTGAALNPGEPVLSIADAGVNQLFLELKTGLEEKDMEAIDRITGELGQKNLDKGAQKTLDAVSDLLLVAKFKQAVTIIETLCGPDHGRV